MGLRAVGRVAARLALAVLVAAIVCQTGLSYAQAPVRLVRVLAWSDRIDGRIFDAFTRESGIRVALEVSDTSDAMEARLRAGAGGYDLVIAEGSALARLVAARALAPLGPKAPEFLAGLMPDMLAAARLSDIGNAHAIPYLWGSIGFGIDTARIQALFGDPAQLGWETLVKPETLRRISGCGFDLIDSPADILPGLLRVVGAAPESRRIEDIRRAISALQRNRAQIRAFAPGGSMPGLASGQACAVIGLSGDIARARQRAANSANPIDIGFILPKEGSALWFDALALPAGAKQPELSQALIAYLIRPDVAARVTIASRFATSVVAARALLDQSTMIDPALYPNPAILRRIVPISGHDARLASLITQEWQRFKSGK